MPLILSNKPYQEILKWLWSDMKMNCSAGFKNVDSTRAVILVKSGRLNGKWKGVDETHFFE